MTRTSPSTHNAPASDGPVPMTDAALEILQDPLKHELDLARSFLNTLGSDVVFQGIEDRGTFASLLHFGIDRGFIRQHLLAEKIHYANSQVGRWASGKAAPPIVVRRQVITEMRHMIEDLVEDHVSRDQRRHAMA